MVEINKSVNINKLFKIKARIRFNSKVRTIPFTTGYRPGFVFNGKMQTSGHIILLKKEVLNLGETAIVEILFFSDELLVPVDKGTLFSFYEGPNAIGDGKVLKVIGWIDVEHESE